MIPPPSRIRILRPLRINHLTDLPRRFLWAPIPSVFYHALNNISHLQTYTAHTMSQQPRNAKGKGKGGRDILVSKALSHLLRHAAEKEGVKMDSQGYANVADVLAWRKIKSLQTTFPEILNAVSSSDKKRFALLHIPSAEVGPDTPAGTTSMATDDKREGEVTQEQDAITLEQNTAVPTTSAAQETATATALAVQDTNPSHFLIRATQGHSIKSVEAESLLEKISLEDKSKIPKTVVHGTFHAAWPAILKSGGLRSMARNQVHFATGPALDTVLSTQTEGQTPQNEPQVISGMRRDAQILIYINIEKALAAGCPFWRSENNVILSEGMAGGNGDDKLVPLEFVDVVVERKRGMGKIWENGQVLQELPADLTKRNPKGNRGNGKS